VRQSTEQIRCAIRAAALARFCRRGYHGTTLDEIAAEVALTRGAVLHHFNSKADLLAAVVNPCLATLDEALDAAQTGDPPTAVQRQQLLSRLTDAVLDNRGAVELLLSDVATRDQLETADQQVARRERVISFLVGSQASEVDRVKAMAALGALLHPAANAWLNLDSRAAREALVAASLAVIGQPAVSE
jgi:AcrR family transcriptional regulator